ncbi:transposase IS3/IS911 family protein [Colwellia psychrerythraea]|uniref:Transposase IS3/IS911 family protein n=1 Tax=Colwellia psychrerythraea TaxID=28229 RepID=A0A099KSR1_COLPS|nr:transposase IS3/IS911 family protein [Colwellia psychrerythraea]
MPKYNYPRRTWKYSCDFKVNAIQLSYVVGVTIKSVGEKLDIHSFMLSRWRKEYREGSIVAGQSKAKKVLTKEQQQLGRESKQLKEELYILKKWLLRLV